MKAYKEKINRYYKYVMDYLPFDQPAPISSLGGSSFGCTGYATGGNQSGSPQAATYPNTGSFYCYEKGGQPGMWFYYYTPSPTKISGVQFHYSWGGRGVYAAFYGSNTNGNWTTLVPQRPCGDGTTTLSFENETPYQYYHLYLLTPGGGSGDGMSTSNIRLYGTEYKQTTVEVTAEDEYDFYKSVTIYKVVKENIRKYYKYDIKDFVQPTLTSEGLLGGSYFACGGQARSSIYAAFDNNASTFAQFGTYSGANNLIFYNPNPLKISSLSFQDYSGAQWNNGKLEYSDDGYTWTLSNDNITNSAVNWSFNVSEQGYHRYWKLTVTAAAGYNGSNWDWKIWDCWQLNINATEKTIVEGTEQDYDFYKDEPYYKAIKS